MCAGRNEGGKTATFHIGLFWSLPPCRSASILHQCCDFPLPFALIDSHAGNKIWLQSSRDLTSFYSAEEHGCGAFMFSHTRRHMRMQTHTLTRLLTHTHTRTQQEKEREQFSTWWKCSFCLLSRLEAINGERAVLYVGHAGSLHGIGTAHMNTCERWRDGGEGGGRGTGSELRPWHPDMS